MNNTTLNAPMKDLPGNDLFNTGARKRGERLPVFGQAAFIAVALVWLGMLIGVSFLATPVKFQAPSLSLLTALDVGRVTFALFVKVEWVLCVLLIGAAFLLPQRRTGLQVAALVCIPVLLAIQSFWLVPVLDARVARIMSGETMTSTGHHLLYVSLDGLKALLLALVSLAALMSLSCKRSPLCA